MITSIQRSGAQRQYFNPCCFPSKLDVSLASPRTNLPSLEALQTIMHWGKRTRLLTWEYMAGLNTGTRAAGATWTPCQLQVAEMTVMVELVTPSPLPPSLTLLHLGSAKLGLIKSRGTKKPSWNLILCSIAICLIYSRNTPNNTGWIVWTLITSVNLNLMWVIPAQKPFTLTPHKQSSEQFSEQVGSKYNR